MAGVTLLVEGSDDEQFFVHLLRRHHVPFNDRGLHLPDRISIVNGGGADHILESLPVRLRVLSSEREPACLGVVLDADLDLEARWQSICARLVSIGYTSVPNAPDPDGTILKQSDLPSVGFWLMPDNQLPGELEHFARLLIPPADVLWPRAEISVAEIPLKQRFFPSHDVMKATLHTWLAWQQEPGKPIGQALTKRFFDADAPQALRLIAWIQALFPAVS
jgi:hypothetical protein